MTEFVSPAAHFLCAQYLDEVGVTEALSNPLTLPLARYIMAIHKSFPIRAIFVVDRPYETRIYPRVFSAMSYDPDLSGPTPSTAGMDMDIVANCGSKPGVVEEWFRDGWSRLGSGVLLLNVCCYGRFADPRTSGERVAFKKLLFYLIRLNTCVTKEHIRIFCMGAPAQHQVGAVLSALTWERSYVRKHAFKNPGSSKYMKGDKGSHSCTFGHPGTSKEIYKIILATLPLRQLTIPDLIKMAANSGNGLTDLSNTTTDVIRDLDAAVEFFRKPGVKEDPEGLANTLASCVSTLKKWNMALSNNRIALLMATIEEPQGSAKKSLWGDRGKWRSSTVAGSQKSVGTVSSTPVPVTFAEDVDDAVSPAHAIPSASTLNTSPAPPGPPLTPARSFTTTATSTSVIFAEDDSDQSSPVTPSRPAASVSNAKLASVSEANDLGIVSAFASDNDVMVFSPELCAALSESVIAKRATTREVEAVLKGVRQNATAGVRTVANALGFEDGIMDVQSPIYQCLLKLSV